MSQHQSRGLVSRLLVALTTGLSIAALSWIGYAAVTWHRYGRSEDSAGEDPLLDQFMPAYEVRERHETRVAAPADLTFATARQLDLQRSPVVRAIFAIRTLPSLLRGEREAERPRAFLAETLSLGWGLLAEVPGREIVMGAVTQPWEPIVAFRALPPDEFAGFDEPGYAKIVWIIAAEPAGPDESLFRTETRVRTTDPESRERFRRYWATFSPGILLIRYEALRLVKEEAERQSRARGADAGCRRVPPQDPT
ncbi:MAG TPA: hypothetical protein VFE37_13695 [Chloroflexota bacterium]|nr:hypothetical protein [Chloroflexota bacterium]